MRDFIILSNNGDWDSDTLGVVGVCDPDIVSFEKFVQAHSEFYASFGQLIKDGEYMRELVDQFYMDIITSGEILGGAVIDRKEEEVLLYVVVKFD